MVQAPLFLRMGYVKIRILLAVFAASGVKNWACYMAVMMTNAHINIPCVPDAGLVFYWKRFW